MYSIGEINISVTGWTVHYLGSGCAPGAAVAAQVQLTTIGFGFDDYSGDALSLFQAYQTHAEHFPGYVQRWASKEWTR